ncbi:A/G-specific DNA-adenine glycosylase [Chitinophaga skermanii]|uniref:Adenine DNA glycosylase n=1 Tax=Chitinophaga skermanii TaxID=331697 RepID=A0A327QKI5_9BACT|nr:A/G-specific adenine glycosylase [Chitinophaga skermanii]RAJ03863.1 A/G-specific DNA-adenine glycosylase [Chitinophaga skermanii]
MNSAGNFFSNTLLQWNRSQNSRSMPWKGIKDPYKIWLSEVILQQTRVEQGWKYYEAFTSKYPTVADLAEAADEDVFRLWQGLGYYARCKNMLAAARTIVSDFGGKFPKTYNEINTLKGIGSYTAAAIASFAYNLPHAVLDGNVYRVLSRYFGIDTPIDTTAGKKIFNELAQKLLPIDNASEYNQSIMDFGAVVCKPQQAQCSICPLAPNCAAFNTNSVSQLPIKSKKLQIKKRYFYYFLALYKNQVIIRKRPAKDIWENLHDFLLVEADGLTDIQQVTQKTGEFMLQTDFETVAISPIFKQQLTHQTIHAQFVQIKCSHQPTIPPGYQLVPWNALDDFAFPKIILDYLKSQQLQLL